MDAPIDIVVTFVNSELPEGQEEYKKYKDEEAKQNNTFVFSAQASGECRFRNGDNFKYGFRSVEQNIPGINKVFLIVEDEKHIPDWLNINHPKLSIVYHRDYIPAQLLPTFNSNTIELFLYRISELADLYLLSNDDMFFMIPTEKELFYQDGIIKNRSMTGGRAGKSEFEKTLNNNHKLLVENKLIGKDYKYIESHLVEIHRKSLEEKLMSINYKKVYDSLKISRFRNTMNYTNGFFSDALKSQTETKSNPKVYDRSFFTNIGKDGAFNTKKALGSQMVCFNDTPSTNFEKAKVNVLQVLEQAFPEKCSFEK